MPDRVRPVANGRCGSTYDDARVIRMVTKLTLSVDERVIVRAKRYARAHGTSVSRLVEQLLDTAAGATRTAPPATPILARLRGSLKGGSVAEYHRHLEHKYR